MKFEQILKFLIRLNVFLAPIYVLSGASFYFLQRFVAISVVHVLKLLGIDASLKDLLITVPTFGGYFAGFIDFDCTGWKSMIAFLALVFATPTKEKKKLYGLIFLPLIFIVNVIRVSFVFFFVSVKGADYFHLIHSIGWSFGMISLVLFLWVLWMKWMRVFERQNSIRRKLKARAKNSYKTKNN